MGERKEWKDEGKKKRGRTRETTEGKREKERKQEEKPREGNKRKRKRNGYPKMGMMEKRESDRAIKSEQGRTLNKEGKPKDRRTEKKTEMKGHLKIKRKQLMMEENDRKP